MSVLAQDKRTELTFDIYNNGSDILLSFRNPDFYKSIRLNDSQAWKLMRALHTPHPAVRIEVARSYILEGDVCKRIKALDVMYNDFGVLYITLEDSEVGSDRIVSASVYLFEFLEDYKIVWKKYCDDSSEEKNS